MASAGSVVLFDKICSLTPIKWHHLLIISMPFFCLVAVNAQLTAAQPSEDFLVLGPPGPAHGPISSKQPPSVSSWSFDDYYEPNLIESTACQQMEQLAIENNKRSPLDLSAPTGPAKFFWSWRRIRPKHYPKVNFYCRCLVGCLFDYMDFPQYYNDDILESQFRYAQCGINCLHYFNFY